MSNNPKLIKNMSISATNKLVKFCNDHDWGAAAHYVAESGKIEGLVSTDVNSLYPEGDARFIEFDCAVSLKKWAGY